jgi:hypothetical protein
MGCIRTLKVEFLKVIRDCPNNLKELDQPLGGSPYHFVPIYLRIKSNSRSVEDGKSESYTKKGSKSKISDYRSISNLCSTSKFFETIILKGLINLQELNGVDFTKKQKNGFKKRKARARIL